MENNYGIGDLAKILGVSTNKIRFYEKKGLINPIRCEENQYRVFSYEELIKLQTILLYRSIGFSIGDIKEIIEKDGKENYLLKFNNQWETINNEIHRLNILRDSLEGILDKIYDSTSEKEYKDEIIKSIEDSNKLLELKNNWNDKWNFDNWAENYDESVKNDKCSLGIYKNYCYILDRVFNIVKSLEYKNPNIVEIGVGTGNLSSKFLNWDCNIIGIDQSREMLKVSKRKYPKLKVRLGEFLNLPFKDKSIDIIVSTYAFHHLNSEEKVLAIGEMARVLKNTGSIVIGDLMFENKKERNEILKDLRDEEIKIIEDEYYSNIDELKDIFELYNIKVCSEKVDRFNHIIIANKKI